MKILIVEDNEKMRRLIRSMLCRTAAEFVESTDGVEAIAAYARHRPDWILMDIGLPNLDGLAAAREIRAQFPEARVVFITQYVEPKFQELAASIGACDYVLKEDIWRVEAIIKSDPSPPKGTAAPVPGGA